MNGENNIDKLKSAAQEAIEARKASEKADLGLESAAQAAIEAHKAVEVEPDGWSANLDSISQAAIEAREEAAEEPAEELPERDILKEFRSTRNPATYEEYQQELKKKLSWWEQIADAVSGTDDRLDLLAKIMIEQTKLLEQGIVVQMPAPLMFPDIPHYNVRKFPLDTARAEPGEEIDLPGDTLTFYTDGSLEDCFIRLDEATADAIPINEFNPYHYRTGFKKFYLETTAQAGKYLRIHIGREAGAEAAVQITATAARGVFYSIRSDKDSNFSGSLAQYAKEDENLTGIIQNKIRIIGISMLADQNLLFKVLFWGKDTFDDSDLDVDTFTGEVEFDLATNGFQIGGSGKYYYDLRGLDLDYEDEDGTKELHVSLYNQSTTSKNAGSTGEVVIEVYYELMG